MQSLFRNSYRYAFSIVRGLDTSGAETPVGLARPLPDFAEPPRLSAEEEAKRREMRDALRSASTDVWCLDPQSFEIVRASEDLLRLADQICHVDCEVDKLKVEVFNKLVFIEGLGWNVTEVVERLRAALAV